MYLVEPNFLLDKGKRERQRDTATDKVKEIDRETETETETETKPYLIPQILHFGCKHILRKLKLT